MWFLRADEKQFSKLENDDQKYDRIVNLVSGVDHQSQLSQVVMFKANSDY